MANPRDTDKLTALIQTMMSVTSELKKNTQGFVTIMAALNEGIFENTAQAEEAFHRIKDLKTVNTKNMKAMFAEMGVAGGDMEHILNIYEKISKVNEKDLKRIRSAYDVKLLVANLLEDEYYFVDKMSLAYDKINQEVEKYQKRIRSIGLESAITEDLIRKALDQKADISIIFSPEVANENKIEEVLASVNDYVSDLSAKKIKIGVDTYDLDTGLRKMSTTASDQFDLLKVEADIFANKLKVLAAKASGYEWMPETGKINSIDKGKELRGAAAKSTMGSIDGLKEQLDVYIAQLRETGSLSEDARNHLSKLKIEPAVIEAAAKQLAINEKSTDMLAHYSERLKVIAKYKQPLLDIQEAGYGFAEGLAKITDVFPSGIAKFLGIDDLEGKFKNMTDKSLKKFNDGILSGKSSAEAASDAMSVFGKGLSRSVTMVGALALAIAAAYKVSSMLTDTYKELSHEMGVSLTVAKKIHNSNLDILATSARYTVSMKELTAMQAEYAEHTGMVFKLTDKGMMKTFQSLGETAKLFGLNEKQAMGLYNTFQQVGADSTLAKTLTRNINYAAELNGLSSTMITQDLIDAAEEVTTYFGGMPEAAAEAAIEVRKLGISLKTAGGIAKRMLNIEGFMTDMYELNAMTGMDLSKAFDLGITGDIEGMTTSIMDSIGSLAKWDAMDYLGKMKLANTLGMSTDEIAESLLLKEKMKDMDKDQLILAEKYKGQLGDISMMSDADIKARLDELAATDKLKNMWGRVEAILVKAILPFAESFGAALTAAEPLVDLLAFGFEKIGWVLSKIFSTIRGILMPLEMIGVVFNNLFKGGESFGDALKRIFSTMDAGTAIATTLGATIGSIWLLTSPLKYLKMAIWPIMKSFDLMKSGAGKVGKVLSSMWGSAEIPKNITEGAKTTSGSMMDKVKGFITDKFKGAPAQKAADTTKGIGETLKDKMSDKLSDTGGSAVDKMNDKLSGKLSDTGGSAMDKITEYVKNIKPMDLIKVAAAMVIMSGALYITAKALKEFNDVDWPQLAMAGAAMGGLLVALTAISFLPADKLMKGAAALAIMGASLIPLAYALNMFIGLDWPQLAMAGAALGGLTVAIMALGAIMGTGVGFAAIGLGAIALAAMGAALIPFGIAIKSIGGGIEKFANGMAQMSSIDISSLLSLTSTFKDVSTAILEIPVLEIDRVVESFTRISDIGERANSISASIYNLSASLNQLNTAISNLDTTKLDSLSALKSISQNINSTLSVLDKTKPMMSISEPSKTSTAQNVNIAKTDLTRKTAQTESPFEDGSAYDMPSGTELSLQRLEMYMKQLVEVMSAVATRPVVVNIDRSDANRIMKLVKPETNNR